MSVKESGSDIDLSKRICPDGNLCGTSVMFDVMHRINTKWLTLSAHVYDHDYRALCTIFTCKLMAKDAPSCKIAWITMQDVAKEHGIPEVHIHGFMADNAIVG
jgi:hypothetical protein